MRRPRWNHSPAPKARVTLEALTGEKTVADLAALHDLHPTQIFSWKNELLGRAAEIFGSGAAGESHSQGKIWELLEEIGELTVEKDFSYGPSLSIGTRAILTRARFGSSDGRVTRRASYLSTMDQAHIRALVSGNSTFVTGLPLS